MKMKGIRLVSVATNDMRQTSSGFHTTASQLMPQAAKVGGKNHRGKKHCRVQLWSVINTHLVDWGQTKYKHVWKY